MLDFKKEAQLPQRDRATRCVSKFVLCFMGYGSYKGFTVSHSTSDLQGHSRALAMVPFDRPHTIFNQSSINCIYNRFQYIITYFPKFKEVT